MTARKPTDNSSKAAGKAAKTIDLTAEDVTRDKAPLAKPAKAESSQAKVATEGTRAPRTTAPKSSGQPAGKDTGTRAAPVSPATASQASELKKPIPPKSGAQAAAKADEKPDVKNAAKETKPKAAASAASEAKQDKPVDATSMAEEKPSNENEAKSAANSAVQSGIQTAPKGGFGSGLLGGLLGGVIVLGVTYTGLQQGMLQLPGMVPQEEKVEQISSELLNVKGQLSGIPKVDIGPLEAHMAELEGQIVALGKELAALQSSEAATVTDGNAARSSLEMSDIKALSERFDGLSGELVAVRDKLSQLEKQSAVQSDKLNANLVAAQDAILSSADRRINDVVTDLANFSDKVEADASALAGRVTSLEENNLSARMQSSARTIALAGLENAVASGADYQLALKTFANVVGEHEAIKTLSDHAATGAPTVKQLADSFRPVYDKVLREAEEAGAATLIDKLLLNAQSLVKVRSLDGEKKGESLTNRLGVIEFHVRNGELAKAADEWNALPPAARDSAAGADWLKGLKTRIVVDEAMDRIRSEFGDGTVGTAG